MKSLNQNSIVLFGGSFNPIHNGHVNLANSVYSLLNCPVTFIPCSPHKTVEYTPFKHRLVMATLALQGSPHQISDYEGNVIGRPSYTIDTVRHFKQFYKNVYWVIGSDNIENSKKWYRYNELKQECCFLVVPRIGYAVVNLDSSYEVLDVKATSTSSTQIRQMIKNKEDVSHLLDKKVKHYIVENSLYL